MKRLNEEDYEPSVQVPFKKLTSAEKVNKSIGSRNKTGYVWGPLDPKFGQRRAFPIAVDVNNVSMESFPDNVEMYLAQVRKEAELCGVTYSSENEFESSVEEAEEEAERDGHNNDDIYIAPRQQPNEYAVNGQATILNEFKLQQSRYQKYRSQLRELDAIELPKTQKQWKSFIWETSCECEYIAQIVEEDLDGLLLVYFRKWLSMAPDFNLIDWIMGILAAIENRNSSSISLLRDLGKKALKQSQVAPDEPNLLKIIVIIGVEFGQRDLLQELTSLSSKKS